jgi:hypothetical protein
LQNLLDTDLFAVYVTETEIGANGTYASPVVDNKLITEGIATSANSESTLTDAAILKPLKDLKTLDLGSILVSLGEALGAESINLGDKFVYTVRFYRLKSRVGLAETAFPYEKIGEQTIEVLIDN